jgi:hypothetical protein
MFSSAAVLWIHCRSRASGTVPKPADRYGSHRFDGDVPVYRLRRPRSAGNVSALVDLLNSFYGLNLTGDDVSALGRKILDMERDFNRLAGFTKEHDRLPLFFTRESLDRTT